MKRAVWAVLFFTNYQQMRDPKMDNCPSGDDSWCKFKNNASSGVAYQPEHSILVGVMDASKSVFCELAIVDLLKKCLHRKMKI